MNKIISIAPNEVSFDVALLHQILAVLGSGVTQQEVAKRLAGSETKEKVRALQAQLGVPLDESRIIDQPTALALERLLKERGLVESTRSFTVAGQVRWTVGTPGRQQRLLAFDLDLRAVGVYRTIKTLAELDKNGGFEFLGEAVSDGDGRYSVTFYDWQYRRAERKKADVVVFSVTDVKGGLQVTGQSRLVTAREYAESGRAEAVDVILSTSDERVEYDRVMGSLAPFLKESGVGLAEIAKSAEQIVFAASELDIELAYVSIAAAAQIVAAGRDDRQLHEALYGIGRQGIELTWSSLYRRREDELLAAIESSVKARIIKPIEREAALHLVQIIRDLAGEHLIPLKPPQATDPADGGILPERAQRLALLNAIATFRGMDFREFWDRHLREQPEFKDKPELVSRLLLAQQLSVITAGHEPLVKQLARRDGVSAESLLEIDRDEWLQIVTKTGVPDFVEGASAEARTKAYADMVQGALNAAFPTKRLAILAKNNALSIGSSRVARGVTTFLNTTAKFDVATSRVDDFDKDISAVAGEHAVEVKAELKKVQRVFQVSPTPEAMTTLLENKLHSASAITEIPRKVFLSTYGPALGGESAAYAVYQRAEHVARKAELAVMHLLDYVQPNTPAYAMGAGGMSESQAALKKQLPNYTELFGSPDLCECEHCRSVVSPASYFVELLRFLWRGGKNADDKSPLDMLDARRPDLKYLPLTCENTNTIIPYIDLATEVMEYYAAYDSLVAFQGFDTGEATAEDLRANPQNVVLQAYKTLKDAKYPFSLPYHQPLDVIRTYSDHLGVSRAEAMRAVNPTPSAATVRAMAAESLRISEEEYKVLTGEAFDGTVQAVPVHVYFGYAAPADLENMSGVSEFLARSGVSYLDLVELIKTRFINPHQWTLDFTGKLIASSPIDSPTMYAKFKQIRAGTLNPAGDGDITAMLNAHNAAHGTSITAAGLSTWLGAHFDELRAVITLYQPNSSCDLDTTSLRTLASIYEAGPASGLTDSVWSRIHRFIRLQRRLGWSIHETDLVLAALGQSDITHETIERLDAVLAVKSATKLVPSQLAVFWGPIDSYGDKSFYRKLFLNKAVQRSDDAFKPNSWGEYLTDPGEVLAEHRSAIQAAFRIREEDLNAIAGVARVIDNGLPRAVDLNTDTLNLGNLSVIYRHVALSKALKVHPTELATLIELYGRAPFSTWDVQQKMFGSIDPSATKGFYEFAASARKAAFKTPVLEYVLRGTVAPTSMLGLDRSKTLQMAKTIRQAFVVIEQAHPEVPPLPMTPELLTAKLALTFPPETVGRFMAIVQGTATFDTLTDKNIALSIPDAMAGKYTYVKGSGRLTSVGVMNDDDQTALNGLAGATAAFSAAVQELYSAPEKFIAAQFDGVFSNLAQAIATLLDHPKQAIAATLEQRLAFVYQQFVPTLKRKLRADAITQHIASLIGLDDATTAVLIAAGLDQSVADLSTEGFSADYFSDAAWTTRVLHRVDPTVDFAWGLAAPATVVPADNFSVRWEASIALPASGEYTAVVDVLEADETFKLYLDDVLVLEKASAAANTSLEAVLNLNAAQMHTLRLDYAEVTQNAGVRLQWKRATTGLEIVPATVAYPSAILDGFVDRVRLWHRAAKFVTTFKLTDQEVKHFISFAADFGGIDFTALTLNHWKRVRDYTLLRDAVPQAQTTLVEVFAAANTVNPAPTVAALRDLLLRATGWNAADLQHLVDFHFALTVADFRNEIALNRLRTVMTVVSKSGLAASTVTGWGAVETDFDKLQATAQVMKNAVKAKYEEKEWLDVAGSLSDKIREHQKAALIGYLLTRPAIQQWGATDADGLFEYFLIDVQMGACMDTSRVVQASAAVQMFVNRCLLNLESDTTAGTEKGVSPGAIDQDRWEWMKNYRVWQANREVFLYPENWLAPEWRMDRSELFKDLESYLVQNDITDRSVEQAFRNYLAGLAEIGNLEMCGLHQEYYDDGRPRLLHVFGRTRHAPYAIYYRTWNEYRKWSAWQKLPVSIRVVENGEHSGVHLIPVVWKKRLFLFWPEFNPQQEKRTANTGTQTAEACGKNNTLSSMQPRTYWDIKLAWSECVDGKWTSKQVSSVSLKQYSGQVIPTESSVRWIFDIDSQQQLHIIRHVPFDGAFLELGRFSLPDITAAITATSSQDEYEYGWGGYYFAFQSYVRNNGTLHIADDDYLLAQTDHKVLATPTRRDYSPQLDIPFFFHDRSRSYFARPVDINIYDWTKNPKSVAPRIPYFVDDSGFWKAKIPKKVEPDDRRPVFTLEQDLISDTPTLLQAGTLAARTMAGDLNFIARRAVAGEAPATAGAIALAMGAPMTMKEARKTTISRVDRAFGGVSLMTDLASKLKLHVRMDKGLEFHTMHHPYSGAYVKRLNETGLPGLMDSDTVLPSDAGVTFEGLYKPNFANGFVQKPADFPTRTYYKDNVCFDAYGANSLYNWELFFHAPLYIATRLSRNGRHREAMKWFHYIFDPTSDAMPGPGEPDTARYWKVLPFKTAPAESLEDWFRTLMPNSDPTMENAIIGEWRDHPFDPHLIASNRPISYMKHVVLAYVQNLVDWADMLFRQDSRESVNEALQLYVVANHILGRRPERVPKRGTIKAESYRSLEAKWDDFSNALVELENIFPYSSDATVSDSSAPPNLLGIGPQFYFCIPPNDRLLKYWDTVADRLFKIRHCQNIDGVERKLALFAPPIDPAAIVSAMAQGMSLGSILADLSSPPPIYRFPFLIQKANEFCNDVKALGAALQSALEKKDVEALAALRATHERSLLESMRGVKERQLLDARARRESVGKLRDAAVLRLHHYADLLGAEVQEPAPPTIAANLTSDGPLPPDSVIAAVEAGVDVSLVDSDESGVKIVPKEKQELDSLDTARNWQIAAQATDALAAVAHFFPIVSADGKPFGVGAGVAYGGTLIGNGLNAVARTFDFIGAFSTHSASLAARMGGYIRREQEWAFQANLAAKDIIQLDKQITSADIQVQVAQKELDNHNLQVEQSQAVEQFLAGKFTSIELYQWQKEQLFDVYKRSYNLAYELAKKTEKAYKFEIGAELASFVQYGYWDDARQGLVAGERLQLALRQLENAYINDNRRELELSRSMSLAELNPLALVELRERGKCRVSIPEELFDRDFRGHYHRRIKAMRLSIPCVAGPYTPVSCSLRLLNNSVRINTAMNSEGNYEHENDNGLWIDDDRFRTVYTPVTAIATSVGQSDAGMFEFSFKDDRYLPFECAGAISEWELELSTEKDLRQFDQSRIADVILHMSYTAREDGGLFKEKAGDYLTDFLKNTSDLPEQPLLRLFSLKEEFPTEWHTFLHPAAGDQILKVVLGQQRFPFLAQNRTVTVGEITVVARCSDAGSYKLVLSYTDEDDDIVSSSEITMSAKDRFGGLKGATIGATDAGLNLEDLDVTKEMTIKLKRSGAANFASLATQPKNEVTDLYLAVAYRLA
jgi:hypothetical protein